MIHIMRRRYGGRMILTRCGRKIRRRGGSYINGQTAKLCADEYPEGYCRTCVRSWRAAVNDLGFRLNRWEKSRSLRG